MPRSVYQRVISRGFHSAVADGVTGAGALDSQGRPLPPQTLGQTQAGATSTLPGYQPDPVAPVAVVPLESIWGLAGSGTSPDQTPRTHAAPGPGWAGSYDSPELLQVRENSVVIHSADFGALEPRITSPNGLAQPATDQWADNNTGESAQDPVTGQLRYMGGRDTIQGYSLRNRYGFDGGHRARTTLSAPVINTYLDPAERPFVVPQLTGSFLPSDTVQGPQAPGNFRSADNINATPPTAYAPPPDPVTQLSPPPAGGPVSHGWW
ncbi:MAG TPA: hypothetical protein VGS06_27175 [Streptosporangiaceae bacterium]|nr:hypothetical protein [Streptosporangiaceae bacterium]